MITSWIHWSWLRGHIVTNIPFPVPSSPTPDNHRSPLCFWAQMFWFPGVSEVIRSLPSRCGSCLRVCPGALWDLMTALLLNVQHAHFALSGPSSMPYQQTQPGTLGFDLRLSYVTSCSVFYSCRHSVVETKTSNTFLPSYLTRYQIRLYHVRMFGF